MIISIKGKDAKGKETDFEVSFKWNNHCFEHFGTIKNLSSISAMIVAFMYCGYKGWCFARNLDERLTLEDFSDYVDLALDDEDVRENLRLITEEIVATPYWKKVNEKPVKKNEVQSAAA